MDGSGQVLSSYRAEENQVQSLSAFAALSSYATAALPAFEPYTEITQRKALPMIEKICHKDNLLAIIVSHKYGEPGIHFFTPDDLFQQLAYMLDPEGKVIAPHVHNPLPREVHYTQEEREAAGRLLRRREELPGNPNS